MAPGFSLLICAAGFFAASLAGQETGTLEGTVRLSATGRILHHADVALPRLGLKTEVDHDGKYKFENVPVGTWDVLVHMHSLSDARKRVTVTAGSKATADFELELAQVREQITVTASGREETSLEAFATVSTVNQLDTATKGATALGELLDDKPGVAKRSFGPGTARPVIRGFDGDRVLVLEDGVRTGTLSSQSGDHGEPIDAAQVERIEIVRGPATLLYGSNAIGGVVNAISPVHGLREKPHHGLSGNVSGTGGTANALGGLSGSFRLGLGAWMLFGGGGRTRTGDYNTPVGEIHNSGSRLDNARFGFGRFSRKASFHLEYANQDGVYGVPFASAFHATEGEEEEKEGEHDHAEDVRLAFSRQQTRFSGAVRDLGDYFEEFQIKLNYTDWRHRELEGDEVGTRFSNKQFVYRGQMNQRRRGRWSGQFGFWGMARAFAARGEEALSPPIDQNAFAAFALEQFDFEKFRIQFGGRLERNSYTPLEDRKARSFTGGSFSAGINVPLSPGQAFVANYSHSYRAPSLEELYYQGPHIGNLAFEIGRDTLKPERGNGFDVGLRRQSARFRGEASFFHHRLSNFIFLAPTGEFEDGLREALYNQGAARFTGVELSANASLHEKLWLTLGFDAVRASIRENGDAEPLPRIPPVRGRVGLDIRHKGLSVRPELALANSQARLFETETRTAGYAVPSLAASYSLARAHYLHVFTVNFFNATNRLYRNHLSLIKDLAPEIGRGVRFSYNLHFY